MALFFIRRPVFAWVIAIIIMLAGIMSITSLPISQYPDVSPPQISISATYPGADAQTLENSVTQVIEQQLTGLDGLLYFSSTSSSSGSVTIDVTFNQGTDPDIAQVQVQNKVQQAEARLPSEVTTQGVTVQKSQSSFLLIVGLYDETGKATMVDISDYLASNLQDPLSRIEGVGSVRVFGSGYAMRIWLNPIKLASYGLMASDIETAIEAQNTQVAAGKVGDLPAGADQQLTATVKAQSRLRTPEQFRNIIVKSDGRGALVHLSDVARVELGSEDYSTSAHLNGYPSAGIAIRLSAGANALNTAELVKAKVAEYQNSMPAGYKVAYPKDSTDFINISIEEVVKTLIEAVVLVVIVMFVFLQNIRTTLIPAITVPVVLLGTFGVLAIFGYSINTLTLFGMVLSIGLLVDDAIVVVENVERVMREEKLSPREATEKSMKEITSALVGIAMVLSAVFLPMAFFGGSTGVIYRQFSITIVSSMVLSVVMALTLAPALCATLLKPAHSELTNKGMLGWFNRRYNRVQESYANKIGKVIHGPIRWLLLYGLLIVAVGVMYVRLPSGFLPNEDQGFIMVQYTLPAGATDARTSIISNQVKDYFLNDEKDNVESIFTINGFAFSGTGQNAGMAFVSLKDWSERSGSENTADSIAKRAMGHFAKLKDAQVFSMSPPPIDGFGQSGGFTFELQAKGATSREELQIIRDKIIAEASKNTGLQGVRANTLPDTSQLQIDIDNDKVEALGLSISDVNNTLSRAFGSAYINDFIDRDRVKKVYMQGDVMFRAKPEDLDKWFVRTSSDSESDENMTPFSAFSSSHWVYGPESLARYNGVSSFEITGEGAAGTSSGTTMNEIEKLAQKYSSTSSFSWSGLSYQERLTSGQAASLYGISLIVVFLCLAALYESWSIPFSVMLVIPMGILGSLLAITLRGLDNDIYFQVALLTIIGLSAKNAILIVEFAEDIHRRGESLLAATIEASRMRLRPILMTSLAFSAGVLPLAISSGAGANSRIAIGTGIIGGTITATLLAIFYVPLFYVLVRRVFSIKTPATNTIEHTPTRTGE